MKKIRIMWLHSHLTLPSGATNYIIQVLREFQKVHSVTMYVQKSTPEFVQLYKNAGIEVITLSKYSTGDIPFWLSFSGQIKKEKQFLKGEAKNYDLVISSMFPMNVIASSLELPHLQFCFQPFAFFWDPLMIKKMSFPIRVFLQIVRFRFGRLDIHATQQSRSILTINEGSKKSIMDIYGRDALPVFMGVTVNKVANEELAKKYAGKKVILHTTDWTPLKQTGWLLQQFLIIQKKYPDVILAITETKIDSLKNTELKKVGSEDLKNVEFLGTVSTDLLHQYFALADIVVYSGFGTAITTSLFVLECMAYETTPVVSKGASEDVDDGKTGLVFDNDTEFQNCIITLLTNENLRQTLGKQASAYISQRHSWSNVVNTVGEECLKLIEKV